MTPIEARCAHCSSRFQALRRRNPAYCCDAHRRAAARARARNGAAAGAETLDIPIADPLQGKEEASQTTGAAQPDQSLRLDASIHEALCSG